MIWNLRKLNIFLNKKIFKRKNIIWKTWNLYVEMIFFLKLILLSQRPAFFSQVH
jgi:hypothetical protein